ncbi:glycosyltransferase family 2 protein [Psychroserpens sp. MEBiC05023]
MVYIVIVTYNGLKWIDKCLKSIDFDSYNVVVIDNASNDTTVSYIKNNYPRVILYEQQRNLGFGQANNIGIKHALNAGANHVFLLNQDAYLIDAVLDKLVDFQKQNSQFGILSPIHVTRNKKALERSFSKYMRQELTGQFYSDFVLDNPISSAYQVPFVNAAAWLISRQCIERIGGFDPLFFHYGEDDNYCQRANYHSFKVGVLPKVYVIHDREQKKQIKPPKFSPDYFKHIERSYKITFANINTENELNLLENKLRNSIFRLQTKLKFKQAAGFKRELALLLRIKPLIKKSRTINKTRGMHYLQ